MNPLTYNLSPLMKGLVMLMVLIALGSFAHLNFERAQHLVAEPATISVSGEGEVVVVPDIAQFSFSVDAEGEDAASAQEASGTKINEILAYLREEGIAENDITTRNYNLYPRYRFEERLCPAGSYCPPGERVQDGFEVSQTVEVKVRDMDAASGLLAGVGERGATNISGLNFTVDDRDAVRAQARAEAIADAQEKAVVLANQLGVQLVRLVGYSDGGGAQPPMMARSMAFDMAAEEAGFGGAELPAGEDTTTMNVTLQYEIR